MSFDSINTAYAGLSDSIKKEYMEAAHVLPFTGLQIKAVFGPGEIENVNKFVAEMKAAGGDNTRKAAAITRYAGVVEKLLNLAKIIV